MENNEFKKVSIKIRMCYYFDDIIKLEDFDFDNILTYEKSHENILIYDISYKTLIVLKPLRIGFDKMDGFIRIYDGTRYLVLLGPEKYDSIYNRIRYPISLKTGITDEHSFSLLCENLIHSYDLLPIKRLTFHNVITLLKLVMNKHKNYQN